MLIKEISVKSCMTKSKLPGCDYVINPYTGCQHGCKYCYAVFIKKFQNIKEDWGEFVHVKVNCPELLVKELEKNPSGTIFMSSVTDLYTPIEAKYKLTRQILDTINKSPYKKKFELSILTKSALVKRDFNLLKELDAEVGCSINTLDAAISRVIEPLASPPKLRVEVLKEAKSFGIKVYGFISPVLPGITDLEEIFRELSFCDYVWIELLNTKKDYMDRLMPVIEKSFPEKMKNFDYMLDNREKYSADIRKLVKELSQKYGLKVKSVIEH